MATSPANGATGVAPQTAEITLTFDRDMGEGMSWTGGPPLFPETPAEPAPHWRDKRTCVLPVKLQGGKFYRVGINSTSHQNFRSAAGEPAPHGVVAFTTSGASKAIESRLRVPQVVKMNPANGATDVDPATKVLRVTFSVPMGEGMSWVRFDEHFPEVPAGKMPTWSGDGKSCLVSVDLQPNQQYSLGINGSHQINFQSKWGIPATPVEYRFQTTNAK